MAEATSAFLQPISSERPAGEYLANDPAYLEADRARREDPVLPGDDEKNRKVADWPKVIRIATDLLTKRTKDLQLAAWLTEGWLRREGVTGLRNGLVLMTELVTSFWDDVYPAIDDGDLDYRAAPLAYIGNYLGTAVRLLPVTESGLDMAMYRQSRAVGYEADASSYDAREAREQAIERGQMTAEEFDEALRATSKPWYRQQLEDIDTTLAALATLDDVCKDRFGADAPHLEPLADAVREVRTVMTALLAQKLEVEPDPMEAAPQPAAPQPAAAPAGAATAGTAARAGSPAQPVAAAPAGATGAVPAPAAVDAGRPLQTKADAEAWISAAAKYLRSQDPRDPAAYLMVRGFRWGELRAGGGAVEPRLLAAPPTELRSHLRSLLLDSRWAELLEAGEDLMATAYGRGWLDLQRYVLAACAGLGGGYDAVGRAIEGALLELLAALPELPTLTLMDDTPTANAETQAWLTSLGAEPGVAGAAARAAASGGGHGTWEQALERVRGGEPDRAIELLVQQAGRERSARDRFLRRTQAASIMVETGRAAIALPILEELLREIEAHSLEGWEAGDVVAEPMALLHSSLQQTEGDSDTMQELYLRICRLDPLRAMKLTTAAAE
jgi:type VI secretion system protein ImpA